jgi:FAD/FMN-containing dehydrogenase
MSANPWRTSSLRRDADANRSLPGHGRPVTVARRPLRVAPVSAKRSGKVSEIVVPIKRLGEAIEATRELGAALARHLQLGGCPETSTERFMLDAHNVKALDRAQATTQDPFPPIAPNGFISGVLGTRRLERDQWARAIEPCSALKEAFDPEGLFNPCKKVVAADP